MKCSVRIFRSFRSDAHVPLVGWVDRDSLQVFPLHGAWCNAGLLALQSITASGELAEDSDISILETTASDGKDYRTRFYNLDVIIAHAIGEHKCSIYSQDISQKSSSLLRLNLILNKLVHSIPNIIQGNTILHPCHRDERGALKKFDYIVSNPPFKLDFSDFRDELDTKANH